MRRICTNLLPMVLFLVLAPTALASTTWYVDGVNGNDGNNCQTPQTACKTIGHAISLAAPGDSIIVAAATYAENLTIGFSLNVIGSGASTTILDGARAGRLVTIPNGLVTFSNVTIRNGLAGFGGGIYNNGLLIINNSAVSGNLAFVRRYYSYGGGIYNNHNGTLMINNSTLSGNTAGCGSIPCAGFGGGIYNIGEVLINNNTLNGNIAYAHFAYSQGGGIDNYYGIVTISNSTLSGNGAARGGAIFGGVTLQNSIVANSGGGNCNRTMSSRGYNLSSDNTCNFN